MTRRQRSWNLIAIYCVAALQMGGAGLSPVLAELSAAFPQYSTPAIQLVSTIPSITVVLTNLVTGALCERFPKKYIIAVGCALSIAFALLGYLFNSSLTLIYIWAAILGVGTSLACTVSPAIVNEMFEPEERVSIFGVRACASSIGTMLMTFVGGYLVAVHWRYGFLVYLIMIPGLILSLAVHPKDTKLAKSVEASASSQAPVSVKALIFPCLAGFSISLLYCVAMINSSMLVTESGFVPEALAASRGGLLTTLLLAVGGLTGLAVNKISAKVGLHCMTIGYALLVIGYGIIFLSGSYWMFLIGGLFCGGAITLVMPHVQVLASDAGGRRQELGLSVALLGANLGTLIAPQLTSLAGLLFGTADVRYRFLLAAIIGTLTCAAVGVHIGRLNRRTPSLAQQRE